jgi:hypothetical protein
VTACFQRLRLAVWSAVPRKLADDLGNRAAFSAATPDIMPTALSGAPNTCPPAHADAFAHRRAVHGNRLTRVYEIVS